VHVTYRRLTRADAAVAGHSPIGGPLEDLGADIVGRWGTPVPAGGEGELLVAGAGVTRGYLGRPGLTAASFVPAAMGVPGARAYASGDVVRVLGDGDLEYVRRLDQQVKLRGHRIELGEVEAAVRAHPAVDSAAVMLRSAGERAYLAAYVVATTGATPAPGELRRAATERLPRYMVPSAFVALDRLPLTRNGKLDVDALPEPDLLAVVGAERVPPRTDTERALAELWMELLDVPEVGIYDGFFELGADSLLVTQFHARLPRLFGIDLPMRRVFQALDIASLAAAIDELKHADDAELSALLDVVESMSDEELRQRLS
jgi:nonribosomal peptide synthetase protein BlmVII